MRPMRDYCIRAGTTILRKAIMDKFNRRSVRECKIEWDITIVD
ncbi:MAG: hypothetical protein ACOYVG_01865 [Bacteroidota bacterium]